MPKTRSWRGFEGARAAKGRQKAPQAGLKAPKSHAFLSLAPHMKAASLASSRSALLKRGLLTLTSRLFTRSASRKAIGYRAAGRLPPHNELAQNAKKPLALCILCASRERLPSFFGQNFKKDECHCQLTSRQLTARSSHLAA